MEANLSGHHPLHAQGLDSAGVGWGLKIGGWGGEGDDILR